jgi:hypothetical protein
VHFPRIWIIESEVEEVFQVAEVTDNRLAWEMNWGEPESQEKTRINGGSEERKETSGEQSIAIPFWGWEWVACWMK